MPRSDRHQLPPLPPRSLPLTKKLLAGRGMLPESPCDCHWLLGGRYEMISVRPTTSDNSAQSAAMRLLRPLLNMSPIMIMPPLDHCPMPPRSGWLNCAMPP